MSKLKTHRGTAKRFKLTASGAVKRKQSHRRHILTKKSSKRKRHLRSSAYLAPCDAPLVIRLLVGS